MRFFTKIVLSQNMDEIIEKKDVINKVSSRSRGRMAAGPAVMEGGPIFRPIRALDPAGCGPPACLLLTLFDLLTFFELLT